MSENNEIKEPLNKNYKVPKLRFPEFYTIYNSQTISSIFKLTGGGTPSTKEEKYWLGTMPWISSSDLIEFDINKISETRFISNEAIENSATKIVPAFSILVVTRVGLGKVAVNEHPICTSQDFTNLYSNNINPYYFAYLIQKHLSKKVPQGSTIKGISSKELAKMNLTYPTKNEQDKIYSFLHILDKKIDVINSKIAILKKYKKGMQKNIFDSSKTKEYLVLKNIVKFENKSKIPANNSIENGNFVLYKSGQKNGTINDYSHEGIYIIANDGGIAQFKLTSGKFAYTDHCICFRCQSDEETIVLCNYLQSLEKKITYVGFTGTGLKNIDRQYLGMIRIPKVDNKKIAKSFNLIDEAIRNYENILEKITIIKKLLLKQMFI